MAERRDHQGTGTKGRPFSRQWLQPPWRRLAVLVICFVWLVAEAYLDNTAWAIIALAALAVGAWEFFFSGKYDGNAAPDADTATNPETDSESGEREEPGSG